MFFILIICLGNLLVSFMLLLKTNKWKISQKAGTMVTSEDVSSISLENLRHRTVQLKEAAVEQRISEMIKRLKKEKLPETSKYFSWTETHDFPKVEEDIELKLDDSEKAMIVALLNELENYDSLSLDDKKALADKVKSGYIHFLTKALDVSITYEFIEENRDFFVESFSSLSLAQNSDNGKEEK